MTKKPLPLAGHFQEAIAAGRDKAQPARKRGGQDTLKSRAVADWLMERVRRGAGQFLSLAAHGGFERNPSGDQKARNEHALLLAYKLTVTAWRRRGETTDREVLPMLKDSMIRELAENQPAAGPKVRLEDESVQQTRRALLDPADLDISAALIRFEAGLPGPLTPFYGDLAPTFGGPCPSDRLASRYGKIVRHLYETVEKKVERKIDERDRALTGETAGTRYAGAGR